MIACRRRHVTLFSALICLICVYIVGGVSLLVVVDDPSHRSVHSSSSSCSFSAIICLICVCFHGFPFNAQQFLRLGVEALHLGVGLFFERLAEPGPRVLPVA